MSTTGTAMRLLLAMGLITTAAGCSSAGGDSDANGETDAATAGSALTAAQLQNGIGPVTSLEVRGMDEEMAERGLAVFSLKCAACHKLAERYVGPPLGDVVERRSPEFIMNMMLNPAEMVEKHPEVREMLAQFMTPMPNQQLTQEDARAVLEYLRSVSAPAGSGAGSEN